MELQGKQKYKKRKTRRNLDELRKRSRVEMKNNANSSNSVHTLHVPKGNNIEQITSKRLTLALFNKTVRSETITRPLLTRIDYTINNLNAKERTVIFRTHKKCQYSNDAKSILAIEKKNPTVVSNCKPQLENSSYNNIDANTDCLTMFRPLNKFSGDSMSDISSEEHKYKQVYLAHTSCSSSDTELEYCVYEKFMNELPNYLKEHFPVLTRDSVVNKSISYIKQTYLNCCNQENQNSTLKCTNNFNVNDINNYSDLIIQKPMDYIQKGSSWQQSMKIHKNSFITSNSSPLLQFGSNSYNNSLFVQDSPEYIYFPHKLNH